MRTGKARAHGDIANGRPRDFEQVFMSKESHGALEARILDICALHVE
jgi:hypothetical protein